MIVHAFNPSTKEAETGGSLWVWGHSGLQELIPRQATKLQRNPVSKNQNQNQNKTKQASNRAQECVTTQADKRDEATNQGMLRVAKVTEDQRWDSFCLKASEEPSPGHTDLVKGSLRTVSW